MRTFQRMLSAGLSAVLPLVLVPFVAHAEGEPDGSFPSWEERVIHQWMNRARCDPASALASCSDCADSPCYSEPVAPLRWSGALNRAARFHSANLTESGCGMMHESPCTLVSDIGDLYPETCGGAPSCACESGTLSCNGTGPWDRIALFGEFGLAENIAVSGDPVFIFEMWLLEPTADPTCGFHPGGDNGHRYNILDSSSGSVGVGMSGSYTTADFAGGSEPGRIPSGAHYPRQSASVELWANWYAAAGPAAAAVNVEGTCYPMDLERGTATNGAWMAEVTEVGSGCHRYYFEFQDSGGTVVMYPTTGSLAIGSGSGCPDWDAARPDSCLGAPDQVFADNFETGNTSRWSAVVPTP